MPSAVARLATAEARNLRSLVLVWGSRRHGVRPGVKGFGYVKGTLTVPFVMVGISVVEVIALHLLIPWEWLRNVLLIATVYSVLSVLAMAATSRVMNPHLVGDGHLTLKWGYKTVLTTPLSNVTRVAKTTDYRHSYVTAEDRQLVLTAVAGANVSIRLAEAVSPAVPLSKRQIPDGFRPDTVLLYVTDPDAFISAVLPGIADSKKEATDEHGHAVAQ